MHPWQMDMLDKMSKYKGRGLIQITGRGTGKSMFSSQAAIDRLMRDLMNRPIEELKTMEGRIYGAVYHVVEPIGGNWPEMELWCIKSFGPISSIWQEDKLMPESNGRWYANDRKFWFRNLKDRDWFILRWSHD